MLSHMKRAWAKAAAMMALLSITQRRQATERVIPAKTRYRSSRNGTPHQGAQEMARRRYQIARRMLTPANGLVVNGFRVDSHGRGTPV